MDNASSSEMPYSTYVIGVNPNAFARNGISITHVVKIKERIIVNTKKRL